MNLIKENKLFEATSLLDSMSLSNEDRNDLILAYSKLKGAKC